LTVTPTCGRWSAFSSVRRSLTTLDMSPAPKIAIGVRAPDGVPPTS
jgi:hypothetical protein